MKNGLQTLQNRIPMIVGAIAMLTISSLFYYSDQLYATTNQTETPTPVPVADVGDTTGLIMFSVVIVVIILAGALWPRNWETKK